MKTITRLSILFLLPVMLMGQAAKKPGDAVSLKSAEAKGELKAGATVSVKATFKLDKGYHVHSNLPSEKNFIATVLTVTAPAGGKVGAIHYPPGRDYKVEGLDKPLSVYEEEFVITVPITLGSEVALPLKVTGSLSYQACQGSRCYPPRKLPVEFVLGPTEKR